MILANDCMVHRSLSNNGFVFLALLLHELPVCTTMQANNEGMDDNYEKMSRRQAVLPVSLQDSHAEFSNYDCPPDVENFDAGWNACLGSTVL